MRGCRSIGPPPDTHHLFLFRYAGKVAGFALVDEVSETPDHPGHLDIAEFFVLRKHRKIGIGIGSQAAYALWEAVPGRWTVRVAEAKRRGVLVLDRRRAGIHGREVQRGDGARCRPRVAHLHLRDRRATIRCSAASPHMNNGSTTRGSACHGGCAQKILEHARGTIQS
jgi:GNAT superfamily N-acetyltransferase